MSKKARLDFEIVVSETAFKCRMLTLSVLNNLGIVDPNIFLKEIEEIFPDIIRRVNVFPCKINVSFVAKFIIPKDDDQIGEVKFINTKNVRFLDSDDPKLWFQEHIYQKLTKKLSEFVERGSGWALLEILRLDIKINKCSLFSAGQNSTFIELPPEIRSKTACINIKSNDSYCFAWCVAIIFQNVQTNVNRVSSYKHFSEFLNLDGIEFPFNLKQLDKFEQQNNVSVNIFGLKERNRADQWFVGKSIIINDAESDNDQDEQHTTTKEKFEVLPIRISKNIREKHANLLMLQNISTQSNVNHFVYIKNLSRLVSSQLNKHKDKKNICNRCLCFFPSPEILSKHIEDCIQFKGVKCVMPTFKNKYVYFKNLKNKERLPFIIYFDLEAYLQPLDDQPLPEITSSIKRERHVAYSVGYYFHCSYDSNLCKYKSYRNSDCLDWFVNELKQMAEYVGNVYNSNIEMQPLTLEELQNFENASCCHICGENFKPGEIRVKDHRHYGDGRLRGAAHQHCNLLYSVPNFLPVVAHNLSGYDSHFFIQKLCNQIEGKVTLLPYNKEKYKSFTKQIPLDILDDSSELDDNTKKTRRSINLRFIDSFNFLPSSLSELASTLREFKITFKMLAEYSDEQKLLLCKKGIFPYNFVDSLDKLDVDYLPSKEHFFNKLLNQGVSDKEYDHANTVWNSFSCKNLGEYSDIYLKTDVLLLADIFECFRDLCLTTYDLDAAYYITSPSLGWDALLKISKVILELITDVDMLLFIERGIRGGLSVCIHRYARANNKYMDDYDPEKESVFLYYFDINNLYGHSMTSYLPVSNFSWLTKDEIENFDIFSVKENSSLGFILEVDLEYPDHLHDDHSDLPFCPEQIIPPGTSKNNQKKLLATLYNKINYVIHYRNLQQALRFGLKLLKIHRVLKFFQAPWMKPYILLNTDLRTKATTKFEIEFYKSMNNSVFGKSMQNVRKMRDVKLVSHFENSYGADYYMSKPNFYDRVIFDENCSAIEMKRCKIFFNKPLIVGFSILEISKTQLYKFHYEYMMKKFSRERLKVIYSDTDSLMYKIIGLDCYEEFRNDLLQWFDTSDYPVDNPFNYPLVNKKVMGLMKDELKSKILEEVVGLRSKMYALKVMGVGDQCKAKGLVKSVRKTLTLEDYKNCLFSTDSLWKRQNLIRSIKHSVFTIEQNKKALDMHDDKRYICEDGIETLAWGHYKIRDLENDNE